MQHYHLRLIGIPELSEADEHEMMDELSEFLKDKGLKNGAILHRHSSLTRDKVTLRFYYDQDRDQAAKALNLSEFLGYTITAVILDPDMNDMSDLFAPDRSF